MTTAVHMSLVKQMCQTVLTHTNCWHLRVLKQQLHIIDRLICTYNVATGTLHCTGPGHSTAMNAVMTACLTVTGATPHTDQDATLCMLCSGACFARAHALLGCMLCLGACFARVHALLGCMLCSGACFARVHALLGCMPVHGVGPNACWD